MPNRTGSRFNRIGWKVKTLLSAILLLILLGLLELILHAYPGLMPEKIQSAMRLGGVGLFRDTIKLTYCNDETLELVYKDNLDVELKGHPEFSYRLKTKTLPGLEGYPVRDDGIDGEVWMAAVGDSFTDGWGVDVELGWVELLEKRTGKDVVNLGLIGYGLAQLETVVKKYATRLTPEIILYLFFENDLISTSQKDSPAQPKERSRDFIGKLHRSLQKRFVTYNIPAALLKWPPYDKQHSYEGATKYYTLGERDISLFPKRLLKLYSDPVRNQKMKEASRRHLRGMREAAKGCGARFVVVIAPTKEETYSHLLGEFKQSHPDFDLFIHSKNIQNICREEKIECHDLTPGFQKKARQGEMLYFRIDGHWNREGYALASDLIFNWLAHERIGH